MIQLKILRRCLKQDERVFVRVLEANVTRDFDQNSGGAPRSGPSETRRTAVPTHFVPYQDFVALEHSFFYNHRACQRTSQVIHQKFSIGRLLRIESFEKHVNGGLVSAGTDDHRNTLRLVDHLKKERWRLRWWGIVGKADVARNGFHSGVGNSFNQRHWMQKGEEFGNRGTARLENGLKRKNGVRMAEAGHWLRSERVFGLNHRHKQEMVSFDKPTLYSGNPIPPFLESLCFRKRWESRVSSRKRGGQPKVKAWDSSGCTE